MIKKIKYINCVFVLFLILVGCSEDTIQEEFFGNLRGSAISEVTGEALSDVRITTSPSTTTVFTDAQGNFSIPNIPVDNYSVRADFDGFDDAFEGVEIFNNQESVVAFELSPIDSSLDAPSAPILVFPEDGAEDLESEVVFEWENVQSMSETLEYNLELRNSFTNEITNFVVVNDSTLTVSNLDLGVTYFWQVGVFDGENPEVLSSIREFSTLSFPSNSFLFVRRNGSNNVIFSGGGEADVDGTVVDENIFQLTDPATNSFRPRRNNTAQSIAFLRSVGGDTHLFTMDLTGENVRQITANVPVSGFRQEQLDFAWGPNGDFLLYPSFGSLYKINSDGTGGEPVYSTTDGSFISEMSIQRFDQDRVLLKTNNILGYESRIFIIRLSTGDEEMVVLEGLEGASGGIEITANGSKVLYARDVSGEENNQYTILESRLFIFDTEMNSTEMLDTGVVLGFNDLDPSFSPSEGAIIFTRSERFFDAVPVPAVFRFILEGNNTNSLDQLFSNASMADWN